MIITLKIDNEEAYGYYLDNKYNIKKQGEDLKRDISRIIDREVNKLEAENDK